MFPEEHAMDDENKRIVWQAFQLLTPSDRRVLTSVYLNGARCVDLGRLERISDATVRKRLSRRFWVTELSRIQ